MITGGGGERGQWKTRGDRLYRADPTNKKKEASSRWVRAIRKIKRGTGGKQMRRR